jgi:hypothetical protein
VFFFDGAYFFFDLVKIWKTNWIGCVALFRQPITPTAHYSDNPLLRQPITPTAHFSYSLG